MSPLMWSSAISLSETCIAFRIEIAVYLASNLRTRVGRCAADQLTNHLVTDRRLTEYADRRSAGYPTPPRCRDRAPGAGHGDDTGLIGQPWPLLQAAVTVRSPVSAPSAAGDRSHLGLVSMAAWTRAFLARAA
jgi:hypothetical protein